MIPSYRLSNERSNYSMSLAATQSEPKLDLILRLSAQTFADRGFEATSMREISRATSVSLSGLYHYFESKQNLLYLIQNNTFTFILERLRMRLSGIDDPAARLRILVRNHIEYFLSHPSEMKVLSHEEDALGEPFREQVDKIKRRYYALAREIFDAVAAESPDSNLNPRVAVLSLFGMMNWIYKWHNPEVDPGAEELTDSIVGIFLHGVVPASASAKFLSLAETPAESR